MLLDSLKRIPVQQIYRLCSRKATVILPVEVALDPRFSRLAWTRLISNRHIMGKMRAMVATEPLLRHMDKLRPSHTDNR